MPNWVAPLFLFSAGHSGSRTPRGIGMHSHCGPRWRRLLPEYSRQRSTLRGTPQEPASLSGTRRPQTTVPGAWPSAEDRLRAPGRSAAWAVRWAAMSSFPSPVIHSARLELREYGAGDAGLVREVLASGKPEALPPGTPSDPGEVPGWLADGGQRSRREGTGVHLMMLDRAAGQIVGSIGLFHADWEVRSVEIGYGVRGDRRGKGYASEALGAVARWALAEGGIQRAWLTANTDNVASVRVAEKRASTGRGRCAARDWKTTGCTTWRSSPCSTTKCDRAPGSRITQAVPVSSFLTARRRPRPPIPAGAAPAAAPAATRRRRWWSGPRRTTC